jgi:SEC-C motif-containing protein
MDRERDPEHAVVEFIAYYKMNGHMHKLHEVSQFVRNDSRWFYVDGIAG